ncbi:MAG: hypothetical protein KJP12_01510 [Acidimicrobiia bacterium]|nr:hypothetical protein [Acidimicrobiia bacterium]
MSQVVRVVPDVPSFAVDDGFAYSVPETLQPIRMGAMVRVPLGGRTVRGYVVDADATSDRKLRPIKGQTGDLPVFDAGLLQTLRWAAIHYVSPLGPMLAKAAPPNVPRLLPDVDLDPVAVTESPLPEITNRAASGGRIPPHALLQTGPWATTVAGLASGVLAAGRNVAVVVPTVGEVGELAAALPFGNRVHMASSQYPARQTTEAWAASQTGHGVLVIGTREITTWPMGDLGLMIVVEPGRRSLKAPQTPTLRVGDIARRRAAVEGLGLVYLGPVPPSEVVAAGTRISRPRGRVWSRVEVVDRRSATPSGIVTDATRRALQTVTSRHGSAFVFVPRRQEYLVCRACGEPRRCMSCGSAVPREPVCRRCSTVNGACQHCQNDQFRAVGLSVGRVIDALRRSIDSVGASGSGSAVVVGTERDLVGQPAVDISVLLGLDSMLLAPNYRAGEEALRIGARVAGMVRAGSGRRCILETGMPDDPVVGALVSGRPDEAMATLVDGRGASGFPPVTEIIAVDLSGPPPTAGSMLELQPDGATVLGPAIDEGSSRWLIQGRDLRPFRLGLRSAVHEWREEGRRVRIDADPIDL